ncbi:zinc finger HIT domain-containing protein 3 [Phlebotomus argentipes]|uniref:zinc finger HIT domain-containing protein 3 n=1 Tax=Phlebotomus argentipes TaxID=94469 RepID=UPI002892ED9A|nr:zinc finger HIT domain-containing protein 3 [Phlebotomus argentipes]
MDKQSGNCVICEENSAKYKCPTCAVPYCSVVCCKKHKESPCDAPQSSLKPVTRAKSTILFPTEDTVPEQTLEMLRNSAELKDLLRNPHLRRLLQELDGVQNAEKAMSAAMQEPLFTEFADQVLRIVEPQEKTLRE